MFIYHAYIMFAFLSCIYISFIYYNIIYTFYNYIHTVYTDIVPMLFGFPWYGPWLRISS